MVINILICINAVVAIMLQSFCPNKRHCILVISASLALFLGTWSSSSGIEMLRMVPWDTVLMVFYLTVFGEYFFESNILDLAIKRLSIICKGRPDLIILVFNGIVFVVSSVVNNFQALLLLLPPLIRLLQLMNNINKRFLTILFSSVLITSNLAGASTPIGDFPALYLLSQEVISFSSYLTNATPFTLIAVIFVIGFAVAMYKVHPLETSKREEKLLVDFTQELYRNVKIKRGIFIPTMLALCGMFVFWFMGYNPTIVAGLGLSFLAAYIEKGKITELATKKLDSQIFIYFICIFIIITSVQQTGVLEEIADWLLTFQDDKFLLIVLFSFATMITTSIVSAGPSTIVFYPVVESIQELYPENCAITCFCLSICAGSSMFLTAATAGPLLTRMTEQYKLNTNESGVYKFTSKNYFFYGLIGSIIIFLSNILYILVKL